MIDRYLAGAATPDEARRMEAWLAADPARRAWLDAVRARVAAGEAWNVDAAWARVAARTTRADRVRPLGRPDVRPDRTTWRTGWRVAASLALVAGAGAAWRAGWLAPRSGARVEQVAMREVVAPRGGRATLRLPDGTQVKLNAGSRLRYAAAGFGAGDRDVWLEGEGYFEVRHDAAHPFRVRAHGGVAEDLGTRFVVRAYPEAPRLEVMVAEGRVALRRAVAGGDSAVLGAGQLGTLAAVGAPVVSDDAHAERYLGWTTGVLVLDDVPLADALPQLERRYDVTIALADRTLGARRVAARFRDQSVAEALDALALALGARYERHGQLVTFHAAEARR
ncbi:MAG: FecR domain-containing protein [Gemmatirosa sp.]|nr:FecR domain-containing protein [Gemmatirosa sp.]